MDHSRSARDLELTLEGPDFVSTDLILPVGVLETEHQKSHLRPIVTGEEITGIRMSEDDIIERLSRLSAYDCLEALGRVSCMLHGDIHRSRETQLLIMRRFACGPEMKHLLERMMGDSETMFRPVFFPQQVIHLTRLAVLHADPRPPDIFDRGARFEDFIDCLLGVSDLFEKLHPDERDAQYLISLMVRQGAINDRHDSILLWGRYYDILVRTWGEVATPEAFDAAAAFRRQTGMSMVDWLATGLAVYGHYLSYGTGTTDEYPMEPAIHFARFPVREQMWRAFVDHNAQTLDQCRASLEEEEGTYGPTQYRAQTFEAKPLLRCPGDRLVPLACDSLERRCTEGMFFELADGAQREGRPREHFTSPFGAVFEEFVARAWERMLPTLGIPRVHRSRQYERKGKVVDSTDIVVDGGEGNVIFCEVVSRRPRVATMTTGDWDSFNEDLRSGPLKKARQLHLNIKDYRDGLLTFKDLEYRPGQMIWPMIVMTEEFPVRPPIPQYVAVELEREGWLQDLPPLAILSATDLARLEALLEFGFAAIELLVQWKGDPHTRNRPFSDFTSSFEKLRFVEVPQARFYSEAWKSLCESIAQTFPTGNR